MTCPAGHAHLTERRLDGLPELVEQTCSTCLHRWHVAHANARAASERPSMGAYVRTTARAVELRELGGGAR